MRSPGWVRPAAAWTLGLSVVVMGCKSSSSTASDGTSTTRPATIATDSATTAFTGRSPAEITPPPAEGKGIALPQPAAPLPEGYVLEEFFVGGTATRFDPVETPGDGFWTVTPAEDAPYRTRVIVRRPANAEDFSGTVVLEWFNVSAIEAAPDWGYNSEEVGREGHAYIGVSTQSQGVEGGETILDVEVDPAAAANAGTATDTSGLKHIDPERYGTLAHPGDAYSFDIFSQVGRAASLSPDQLLGGFQPKQVIAIGESQSAMFLTTLVNAVHPIEPVFDGFLIHSRAANAAPLDGDFLGAAQNQDPEAALDDGVLIRTDLDVPVVLFETETDLTLLGYVHARQPDTDRIRTWEVAGTAHADAQTLRSMLGGPRDPGIGSLLGCESINTGPHKEVVQALLHHLVSWAGGGQPPPSGERIEVTEGDDVVIERDEHQNAVGGVRNPLTDVPTATLSGEPPEGATVADLADGKGDLCILFGKTVPFDQTTLVALYGTADNYVQQFRASAQEQVAAGFLLQPDADELITEAEANRALFP